MQQRRIFTYEIVRVSRKRTLVALKNCLNCHRIEKITKNTWSLTSKVPIETDSFNEIKSVKSLKL